MSEKNVGDMSERKIIENQYVIVLWEVGYRQSFRHLLLVTNSPQNDNILVFNHFSFRHITDMSPTFFSDIYIGITATITATLPPKQYLHRHFTPTFYTDKTASTFSVHRPAANLITFAKLSQKG